MGNKGESKLYWLSRDDYNNSEVDFHESEPVLGAAAPNGDRTWESTPVRGFQMWRLDWEALSMGRIKIQPGEVKKVKVTACEKGFNVEICNGNV